VFFFVGEEIIFFRSYVRQLSFLHFFGYDLFYLTRTVRFHFKTKIYHAGCTILIVKNIMNLEMHKANNFSGFYGGLKTKDDFKKDHWV